MRRTPYLLALAAVLALVAGPATADHVSEPTKPVDGFAIRLYEYQNLANTLLTACDGSEVVNFNPVRVESLVTSTAIGNTGDPSEHYNERVKPRIVVNLGQSNEKEQVPPGSFTYVEWKHSNIPPHAAQVPGFPARTWESSEDGLVIKGLAPGTVFRVYGTLTGRESGNFFEVSCTFTVGTVS